MATQVLHLAGGGPGGTLALRKHFHAALAAIARPRPLVAYVGVASDDNAGFYAMIRGALALQGARMRQVKIASPRAKLSDARALLEECDLIFVSGGDVEHGMKVLHDRDMAAPIVALAGAGKPLFGVSAGSIMLAREWVRFPDEDDESTAEVFPCLGLAPIHVDAHSEDDGWSELRVLVALLGKRGDRDPVGYGLTVKGALRVTVDDRGRSDVKAVGTPIPRVVLRNGKPAIGAAVKC
jgi:peptidase E